MTFYEFIKLCLEEEAVRTEPDGRRMVKKVLEEIEIWNERN